MGGPHGARSAPCRVLVRELCPDCVDIMQKTRVEQCGLCAEWTQYGEYVPSGNRDVRTGETPVDNFVCWRCKREAHGLNLLGKATQKWLLEHRSVA